jgi:threonine aldolase
VYRVKRAGHVTSKMRFQSAQLIAYLTDGLWLRTAANANQRMHDLADGLERLGVELINRPEVNMLFARVDEAAADQLESAGLLFYRMGPGVIRLVTSWQTTSDEVEAALAAFEAALR